MSQNKTYLIDYDEGRYIGTIDSENGKKPHGTFTFRNGNVYTGEVIKKPVRNSNMFSIIGNGIGKMVSEIGVYEGEFKNYKLNGYGVYTRSNGKIFEGKFVDNQIPKGKLTFPNGCIYVGDINGTKMEGKGILTFVNGDTYDGYFLNNKFHGKAKVTFYSRNYVFIGNYKLGKRDGKAKILYENGDEFNGVYKNDIRISGKYTFIDGTEADSP